MSQLRNGRFTFAPPEEHEFADIGDQFLETLNPDDTKFFCVENVSPGYFGNMFGLFELFFCFCEI